MAKCLISLFQPALDIVLIILLAALSISLRLTLEPFQRGFFCDDQSIQYPYHSSSVTATVMYCASFIIPCAAVSILEIGIIINRKSRHITNARKEVFYQWLQNCLQLLIIFFYGAAVVHLTTNIAKYSTGRLRPHFIYICQPDFNRINCSSGYIEEAHCTGDPSMIREARVSFPSGHSSMIAYAMMFAMMYLEKRFAWKGSAMLKPFIQLMLFYVAFYISLTRISDNKHHWTDVFSGCLLGVLVAIVMMWKAHNFLAMREKSRVETKRSVSVQDERSNTTQVTGL